MPHDVAGAAAAEHVVADVVGAAAHLAAAQVGWLWHDGAPSSAEARLAFLRFDALDELATHGLARTNSVRAGAYAHDFHLLDLQLATRAAPGALPCEVRLDVAQNLGADAADRALRVEVFAGDVAARGHFQVGYVFQRLERDAVLAAFDSHDWWFHSAARGHRITAGVGLSTHASARVSTFLERRDDLDTWTKRLLADLRLVF